MHFTAILITILSTIWITHAQLKSFPGAEGAGAYAVGGRGGTVYKVTSLKDTTEAGTLRSAVNAKGARIVVFDISGTIKLTSHLKISNPYITIAGQTAPGGGITLSDFSLLIQAPEVIVRYIRVRPGDVQGIELDAVTILGSSTKNVVLDHVSATWAVDETVTTTGVIGQVSVQWCIIGQSLHNSVHGKGNHGYGSLIRGGTGTTYHHNLYADNRSRNPRPQQGYIEFSNNVLYDWNENCGYNEDSDPACYLNYRNNYGKPGPFTVKGGNYLFRCKSPLQMYLSGNGLSNTDQSYSGSQFLDNQGCTVAKSAFTLPGVPVTLQSATSAYDSVLADVGCTVPVRDSVDTNIINNVKNNKGVQIDTQTQVGGWPTIKTAAAPTDTDKDGMPDAWETANKFDPKTADSTKVTSSGYTAIETYINDIAYLKKQAASAKLIDETDSTTNAAMPGWLIGTICAVVVLIVIIIIVVVVLVKKRPSISERV